MDHSNAREGCYDKFKSMLSSCQWYIIAVLAGVGVLEIMVIVLALCIIFSHDDDEFDDDLSLDKKGFAYTDYEEREYQDNNY